MWWWRDVAFFNGLMYILSTGCQWRAIPKDLPPRFLDRPLYDYFDLWEAGTARSTAFTTRFMRSVAKLRLAQGKPDPRAIIDSQSIKSAEKRACDLDPTGYLMQARRSRSKEAGTSSSIPQGLLMHAIVHSADIQDRDGGALLMAKNLFGASSDLPESKGFMPTAAIRGRSSRAR